MKKHMMLLLLLLLLLFGYGTHLPAVAGVLVVLEVVDNPLIDLVECHAATWRAVDGERDQIDVAVGRLAVAFAMIAALVLGRQIDRSMRLSPLRRRLR